MIIKPEPDNIRVPIPDKVKKEMFAVVAKILGGSRMDVKCQDGNSRMARIPGSKKRRMGRIRIGDLLIIVPWDVQDEKSDIIYRYMNNEAEILKRKNVLPKEVILFSQGG